MKTTLTMALGAWILLASMLAWIYGGAQIGFYKTYYTVEKVDEITGLSYREEVPAFLPGIETLVVGFAAFALLTLAGGFWEQRRATN